MNRFLYKSQAEKYVKLLVNEGVGNVDDFYIKQNTLAGGQKFYTVEESCCK